MNEIYCAFDSLNPSINPATGEVSHTCSSYGTFVCEKCPSRYDGERIKEYMKVHPREH